MKPHGITISLMWFQFLQVIRVHFQISRYRWLTHGMVAQYLFTTFTSTLYTRMWEYMTYTLNHKCFTWTDSLHQASRAQNFVVWIVSLHQTHHQAQHQTQNQHQNQIHVMINVWLNVEHFGRHFGSFYMIGASDT